MNHLLRIALPVTWTLVPLSVLTAQLPGFSRADLETREDPTWAELVDLDHDDIPDLVVSNSMNFSEYITVFLADSAGSFTLSDDYLIPRGNGVRSFSTGDFDEDGHVDVLVPCWLSDQVFLFRGDGEGGLGVPEEIWAGLNPDPVTVGDFNDDGHLDFAASSWITGYVNVMLGTGDGTFLGPDPYDVRGGPNYSCVDDFNEDGIADIAVANSTFNDVALLEGRGDGTFLIGETFDVLYDAYMPAPGDFNEDGHTDIACATHRSLSILHGDGNGGFERVQDFVTVSQFKWVRVGDFNEDRHDDIALCIREYSNVVILEGNGTGLFGSLLPLPVGTSPQSLVISDVDLDGHDDLVTAGGDPGSVTFLGNDMDESLTLEVPDRVTAVRGDTGFLNATLDIRNRNDSAVSCDLWLTISENGTGERFVSLEHINWPANPFPLALDPHETLSLGLAAVTPLDSVSGNYVLRLRLGLYPETLYSADCFDVVLPTHGGID